MKKLYLYFNTIKYLRYQQVFNQIKYRLSFSYHHKSVSQCNQYEELRLSIPELDLNKEYLSRFQPQKILHNIFTFLNQECVLDLNRWRCEEMSNLWNFNLHYFEFAIALGVENQNNPDYYKKFKELFMSWNHFKHDSSSPAWHPYVISLRSVNLLIAIELFHNELENENEFSKLLYNSIYSQYCFLIKHQEFHLLGNHYLENIKAILIGSFIFGEEHKQQHYLAVLKRQLREQILPDGMHFERSVLYHKLILENLLRIWQSTTRLDIRTTLRPIMQEMVNALYTMSYQMGKIAHFNDSAEGVAKSDKALYDACLRLCSINPVLKPALPSAGYYRLDTLMFAVLIDCGVIGPDYIPGHGHCDALSFELSLDNQPIFVNSGTYGYQGIHRKFIRSTKAHNTLTIHGAEQSECWGEHRVARRIYNVTCDSVINGYRGSYKNYRGDTHIREFELLDQNKLKITDTVICKKEGQIKSYLHLFPKYNLVQISKTEYSVIDRTKQKSICTILIDHNSTGTIMNDDSEITQYYPVFGGIQKKDVLEILWNSKCNKSKIKIIFLKEETHND